MASQKLLASISARGLVSRLSQLSVTSSGRASAPVRFFTTSDDDKDDPFGMKYEDGKNLPPAYVRDKTTGKFTGEVMPELSAEDEKLLKMNAAEKESILVERLTKKWDVDGDSEISRLADEIAEEEMALNTFGRKPTVQSLRGLTEDGEEAYPDKYGFSQPLSPDEFKSFSRYMKKEYNEPLSKSDITVLNLKPEDYTKDNPDLDLKWMSTAAQREMGGFDVADPLADLMPHDMNPTRLVNRKKAKPIPAELLHHNNLGLLRRYISPNGSIMNRSQSRLGAKDQRKIAKLIKRARALGLIPYLGQWKYENHGNIYEADIHKKRPWEEELERRGLVVKPQKET